MVACNGFVPIVIVFDDTCEVVANELQEICNGDFVLPVRQFGYLFLECGWFFILEAFTIK